MPLIVGHNDPGYLPDRDPREVSSLQEARETLREEIEYHFMPEVDGEELTQGDVKQFMRRADLVEPGSTLILRGHAFWVQ